MDCQVIGAIFIFGLVMLTVLLYALAMRHTDYLYFKGRAGLEDACKKAAKDCYLYMRLFAIGVAVLVSAFFIIEFAT